MKYSKVSKIQPVLCSKSWCLEEGTAVKNVEYIRSLRSRCNHIVTWNCAWNEGGDRSKTKAICATVNKFT